MMTSQNPFEKLQEDSVDPHSFAQKVENSNESRLQPQWLQSSNQTRRGISNSFKNSAEEVDEDDNWSISTNKNIKRSNVTKYNRKQMLNLWKDFPLPAELANFPTIIVQKCLTPVGLLPNEAQEEDSNRMYNKSRFLPPRTNQQRGRSQPFTGKNNRGRGRSDGQRMWSSHERDREFSKNSSFGRTSQDLDQNRRSTFQESEPDVSKWLYKDPQGEVQGPFTDVEMNEWYEAGYFSDTLLVRHVHDLEFIELRYLLKKDGSSPFLVSFEKDAHEENLAHTETSEQLLMTDKFGLTNSRDSNNVVQQDKFWNKSNETWNRDPSERDVWQTPGPSYVQKNPNDTLKRKEGVFLLDHSGTTVPATNTSLNTLSGPPIINPINAYPTNMLPMYVDPWQQRHPPANLQHPPAMHSFSAHSTHTPPIDPRSEAPARIQEKIMTPDIWTNTESLTGTRAWNPVEHHVVPEQYAPQVSSFAQPTPQAVPPSGSAAAAPEEIKAIPAETELTAEPTENEKATPTPTDNKSKSQKKKEKNQKQKKQSETTTNKNQPATQPAPWVPPPTESRKLSLKDIQEEELRNKKQAPQVTETIETPDKSVTATNSKQEQKKEATNNSSAPAWGVSALPKSTARSFKEIQEAEVQVRQTVEEKKKDTLSTTSPQPKKPVSIVNPTNTTPPPKSTAAMINPEEFPSLPSQPKPQKAPTTKPNTTQPSSQVSSNTKVQQPQPTTSQTKQPKTQTKKKGLVKVDPSLLSFSVTNSSRVMGEIESFED